MKKVSIFLILYLFLVYFMLVTVFCYQMGKTGTLTEAFEGLWKAIQSLIPVFIGVGIALWKDRSEKRHKVNL